LLFAIRKRHRETLACFPGVYPTRGSSMKLTTANIAMPKGKRDHVVFDDTLRGFGLRLRIGNGEQLLRSWIIQTRMQGRMRRMLIGSCEVLPATAAALLASTTNLRTSAK